MINEARYVHDWFDDEYYTVESFVEVAILLVTPFQREHDLQRRTDGKGAQGKGQDNKELVTRWNVWNITNRSQIHSSL